MNLVVHQAHWKPWKMEQKANIKIKKEYLKTVVAFGSNGFSLEKRSPEELIELAIISFNNKSLQNLFENPLPDIEELKKMKMETAEKKINNAWKTQSTQQRQT